MTYTHYWQHLSTFFLTFLLLTNHIYASKETNGEFSVPQDEEKQTIIIKQNTPPQKKPITENNSILKENNEKGFINLNQLGHPLKNQNNFSKEEIKEKSRVQRFQEKTRRCVTPIEYSQATLEKIRTGQANIERSQVTQLIIDKKAGTVLVRQ